MVRAGEVFKVSVTMLRLDSGPVEVRASILEDSNDVINASILFDQTGNQILEMTEPVRKTTRHYCDFTTIEMSNFR